MVTLTGTHIYVMILIAFSIIGGILNLQQLLGFMKQSKRRFLSSRNPPLIITYCIISLAISFTTTPVNLYIHGLASMHSVHVPFFAKFTTEFFQEFCNSILLVFIVCRSWLLFYDYKFSESSSDLIWRHIVDSDEDNFWISHRKTLGNLYFVICIALSIDSISLIGLSLVGSIVLKTENSLIFHYFSLFAVGIPLYLFIIYLIMYKVNLINDIYLIQKEIKYLSVCILARILAFAIDIFLQKYDGALFFYTIEVVTLFMSVWIQCWWVLQQLKELEKERDLDYYIQCGSNSVLSKDKSKQKRNPFPLKMDDIFDEEISFQTFIRHCTQELSVESILFLIETVQFKATLDKYNATGFEMICNRFIDVSNSNLVQFIKHMREERMKSQLIIHAAPEPVPATEYVTVTTKSASDGVLSLPTLTNNNDASNTVDSMSPTPPPPMDDMISNITPSPEPKIPYLRDNNSSMVNGHHTISLKLSTQNPVASFRQESEYKRFQETVLEKKWLPIARPLLSSKNNTGLFSQGSSLHGTSRGDTTRTERSKTKSRSGTGTGSGKSKTPFTKSSRNLSLPTGQSGDSKESKEEYLTPISLAVIEDAAVPSNSSKNDEKSQSKSHLTVDVNWMYDYGRHLYLKYVDNSADLAINVSHGIRKNLWSVFSKEINEEAFQKIQLIHHDDLSKISHLTPKEENLLIQSYLYHAFDTAFHSVWLLLQSDTFYRFQKTTQYKKLCAVVDAKKLQHAREERDKEYSQSYQETFLEI